MGEKVYKPIMNTGDHLVQSKDNPDRVRGLTRDMNNQNPGIPEWEELDLEDLVPSQQEPEPYEPQPVQLTPEEEKLAKMAGEALGAAICRGTEILIKDVISPWWKNVAWPWIKDKGEILVAVLNNEKTKAEQIKMPEPKETRPTVPDVEIQTLENASTLKGSKIYNEQSRIVIRAAKFVGFFVLLAYMGVSTYYQIELGYSGVIVMMLIGKALREKYYGRS